MKTRTPITELGVSGCEGYGCWIYLCTNHETIRMYADCNEYDDYDLRDECQAAIDAAARILMDAGLNYQLDGNFSHWNAGPHSGVVQLDYYRSDVEDEGEGDDPESFSYTGDWSYIDDKDVPDSIKAQAEEACEQATKAVADTMQARCKEAYGEETTENP